jgi:hypothetical protein
VRSSLAEIRIKNLKTIAAGCYSVADLNARLGRRRADPYLYQILQGTKNRSGSVRAPGGALCKEIEKAFGLPAGWMNAPHAAAAVPPEASGVPPPSPAAPLSSPVVPLLSAAAGETFSIDPRLIVGLSKSLAVFLVSDETMTPRFFPGDVLFIDLDQREVRAGFFVVEAAGNIVLRKIGADIVGRKIVMADGLPGVVVPVTEVKILGAVVRAFRPIQP